MRSSNRIKKVRIGIFVSLPLDKLNKLALQDQKMVKGHQPSRPGCKPQEEAPPDGGHWAGLLWFLMGGNLRDGRGISTITAIRIARIAAAEA